MKTAVSEPTLRLIADDQPTTCPYDGVRTFQTGEGQDSSGRFIKEECPQCHGVFFVYED